MSTSRTQELYCFKQIWKSIVDPTVVFFYKVYTCPCISDKAVMREGLWTFSRSVILVIFTHFYFSFHFSFASTKQYYWFTSMTKHFSWEPPVSADSSYFRLRRFSFSSITGFLPFLVRIGPWPPCPSQEDKNGCQMHRNIKLFTQECISFFLLLSEGHVTTASWLILVSTINPKGTQAFTSSDVEDVGTVCTNSRFPPVSPVDSDFNSEPVGRPRSCKTWNKKTNKKTVKSKKSDVSGKSNVVFIKKCTSGLRFRTCFLSCT